MLHFKRSKRAETGRIPLEENGRVAVIGGGPAGSFFAIHLLREAKRLGRTVHVTILERHKEVGSSQAAYSSAHRVGCNYCAGGISPRLYDFLKKTFPGLPKAIIQHEIRSITIQGYWKNIELELPPGRQMFSVYRGSRPFPRADRYDNFDSFLLEQAVNEGAELVTGQAYDLQQSEDGKPKIHYLVDAREKLLEADFIVLACGVNHDTCRPSKESKLLASLQKYSPAFAPPPLRRAFIFELELEEEFVGYMEGEVHFIEYGSPELKLEMSSLVPKGRFVTVVLLGATIDRLAGHSHSVKIVQAFLDLPHIRKMLPRKVKLVSVCICQPNIVVGTAKNPFGERIGMIGDLVTSRRYKDGIFTAAETATALADTLLQVGVDTASLKQGYRPVIARIHRDNYFGRVVFLLHKLVFGMPLLSRIFYQAVITERKTHARAQRRLEGILWRIASGDDSYQRVFAALIHPATLGFLVTGGLLVTLRNYLTERIFGLRWQGVGRFTTDLSKERWESKRMEFVRLMGELGMAYANRMEFEKMYSIRIKATKDNIINELGRFGESDRGYFKPHWVQVSRTSGKPNVEGCVLQYEIPLKFLNFSLVLVKNVAQRYLVYRIRDGFAQGGILVFDIAEVRKDLYLLSIYVAFDFFQGRYRLSRPFWSAFRHLFPSFVHDVLWNYSLCQLKDIVESKHVAEVKIESVLHHWRAEHSEPPLLQPSPDFHHRPE